MLPEDSPILLAWSIHADEPMRKATDVWDKKDLDDLGPAQITFGRDRIGELNLIAIEASVDYLVGTRDGAPIAEFSWEGDDDGRPTSGRGMGTPGRPGRGRPPVHSPSDEAEFVAKRFREG